MKLNADSYFCIGQTHSSAGIPCQDYALSSWGTINDTDEAFAVAAVSDGCSTGRHTDIGARVIATALSRAQDHESVYAGMKCLATLREFGSARLDGLATYNGISIDPNGAKAALYGDGVYAHLDESSGELLMVKVDWPDNKPFYPIYTFIEGALERFMLEHGGDNCTLLEEEMWKWSPDDGFVEFKAEHNYTIRDGIDGLKRSFPVEGPGVFAVFSDGIAQITGMDWREAVVQAMSFKNYEGRFVARRMMSMLKKAKKSDCLPLDDISCAAIHVS